MIENLEDAKEELKRVDHLIHVSLKYTRTADVIINTLNRMISSYEFLVNSLLKCKFEGEIPETPVQKGELLKEIFKENETVQKNMELYLKLRKIVKTNFDKECEYRRHVAIICDVNDEIIKVDIDMLEEFHALLKELYEHIKTCVASES